MCVLVCSILLVDSFLFQVTICLLELSLRLNMQLVCCIEFVRICQVFLLVFLGKNMETGKVNNNRCETVKIGNVIRRSVAN